MPAEKQVHETLDRLLGNHWSEAFKIGVPARRITP
jgi:hypothetical protein